MKILIFGDIHGRTFWKNAVNKYLDECDKIIFLGDYLDEYPDEGITRKQSKENFEEILKFKENNVDKVILLLGNHDEHYINKKFSRSTRYSSSNAYKYREMFLSHMSFFKIAHEEIINDKKYLFTHAGLMNSWVDRNKDVIEKPTVENLNILLTYDKGISALSDVSKYRSWFGYKSGSILWSDLGEKIKDFNVITKEMIIDEDSIVEGYDYQIFGHTRLKNNAIINEHWACIDCKRAFILNEKEELIEYIEKENEKVKTDKKQSTVQDIEDDKP